MNFHDFITMIISYAFTANFIFIFAKIAINLASYLVA